MGVIGKTEFNNALIRCWSRLVVTMLVGANFYLALVVGSRGHGKEQAIRVDTDWLVRKAFC